MSVTWEIDASDVEAELRRLNKQIDTAGLTRFQEERVWPWLFDRTEDRFLNEGDAAVGGAWKELTGATWSYRRHAGFPPKHPINERTGGLRAFALTHQIEVQRGGVTLTQPRKGGTAEQQLKFSHAQRGGVSNRGPARTGPAAGGGFVRGVGRPFPARPVVGLGRADERQIQARLWTWVVTGGSA